MYRFINSSVVALIVVSITLVSTASFNVQHKAELSRRAAVNHQAARLIANSRLARSLENIFDDSNDDDDDDNDDDVDLLVSNQREFPGGESRQSRAAFPDGDDDDDDDQDVVEKKHYGFDSDPDPEVESEKTGKILRRSVGEVMRGRKSLDRVGRDYLGIFG